MGFGKFFKRPSLQLCLIITILGLLVFSPATMAAGSDYFVYSSFDTGLWGSYGVDGFVGSDGTNRIILYSGSTAYIYKVTLPEGADPNLHPNNPEATGEVAPREFTLERKFELGVWPSHQSEFYVDEKNNVIYLGASEGIRKFVFDSTQDNYVFDSMVAPPSPTDLSGYSTQDLAYDQENNIWYAGAIDWNDESGITPRTIYKYDGSQGTNGVWTVAFTYTTNVPGGSHHDGLEFINGYLYLADYLGDYIQQYKPDGTLVNIYWHDPLNHELEGMGYGALGHFWCGSHGSTITEFGGGKLQNSIINNPPAALNSSVVTNQGATVIAPMNGSDPDGNPLTYSIVSGPAHGTIGAVNGNTVEYTPAAGFVGTDSFTFKVNDGKVDSNIATVTITVNPLVNLSGRMTGGGSIFTADGVRVTHGFSLSDNLQDKNNLEINWGKGSKFHLTSLDTITLIDDPGIVSDKPDAGFDTFYGAGTGLLNNESGYKVKFVFVDAGEPGTGDVAKIMITDANGNIVLEAAGNLDRGNHQAHNG